MEKPEQHGGQHQSALFLQDSAKNQFFSEARQYSGRAVSDGWTCPFIVKAKAGHDDL